MTIDNENRKNNVNEHNRKNNNEYKNQKGITTQTYKNNIYNFWHLADIVYPHISKFLYKEFPDSIIIRELHKIDYVILKENLPVEVQSTGAYNYEYRQTLSHSGFEQKIEKQLKQNIDRYDKCLFFFDSEYLRYLQNDITNASSINWDWFYKSIKDGKLRVFTVRYDGIIKEVFLKDFEFVSKISKTCQISRDSDRRILERNKFKIINNVLIWCKFSREELDGMYDRFKLSEYGDFDEWLSKEGRNNAEIEYYYIRHAATTLKDINNLLDCKIENRSYIRTISHYLKVLGLIDVLDTGKVAKMRKFTDYADTAQYFPGYMRNKDLWDGLKDRYVSYDTFCGIVMGKVDINWWKKQKTIDNAW